MAISSGMLAHRRRTTSMPFSDARENCKAIVLTRLVTPNQKPPPIPLKSRRRSSLLSSANSSPRLSEDTEEEEPYCRRVLPSVRPLAIRRISSTESSSSDIGSLESAVSTQIPNAFTGHEDARMAYQRIRSSRREQRSHALESLQVASFVTQERASGLRNISQFMSGYGLVVHQA